MDLGTLVRLVLRRWYVAGPILVITAVLALQTYQSVRPTYEGISQVLLLAPNARFDDTETNPYASFDRGIDIAAQAMALILTSSDSRETLASEGLIGAYTVSPSDSGPILLIRTRSRNPDMALDTLDGVIERLREVLAEEQSEAGAPSTQLITTNVLSRSPRPNVLYAARDRSLAAIVGLGVIAAIASVLVVESLADRRRRGTADEADEAVAVAGAPIAGAGEATLAAHPVATGVPANGVPATGVPATGVPANGVPAAGVPAEGAIGVTANGVSDGHKADANGHSSTANGNGTSTPPADRRASTPTSGGRPGRSDGPLSEWLS